MAAFVPAPVEVDPALVLLVARCAEELRYPQNLAAQRGTACWLGARGLAVAQGGWSVRQHGLQPRLLCTAAGADELGRLCTAPLLSASLQSYLDESLLLWQWGGQRERRVGATHFLTLDLPALILGSQALQVLLAAALVRTENREATRTFGGWYTGFSVGSTGVAMAFAALQVSGPPPPGSETIPALYGLLRLPPSAWPFICWEPLLLSAALSPVAAASAACSHVSGIWAGLLWARLGAGGVAPGPRLRNGVLQAPGAAAERATGYRLGGREREREWWYYSPLLVHVGITLAVLGLCHAQRKREDSSGAAGRQLLQQSRPTSAEGGWQWPQLPHWLAADSYSPPRSE